MRRFALLLVQIFIILLNQSTANLRTRVRSHLENLENVMNIRERVSNRLQLVKERNTARVCYAELGCFEFPHSRSPLTKLPDPPETLDTQWFLFRRNINFSTPEQIRYIKLKDDLLVSKLDLNQPVKMFIHGYMSNWNERGALIAADAYLRLSDCNYLVMDWSKGARGPQYATAAANTEVVGRQLGIFLQHMINGGTKFEDIHLIGFSLGAHVAACASEMLKAFYPGKLIGRITGLDAAGPLFRHDNWKEKSKKLDKSDASYVDVVHSDSSPSFIDGFGLWEPIGHVDFFANGGQEQPGCKDKQASILQTTLDRNLDRDVACSHIRAVHLYLETLLNKLQPNSCKFIAFKCAKGYKSFQKGQCFPQIEKPGKYVLDMRYRKDIGVMGEDSYGDGVMFFMTTSKAPFCGTELQVVVLFSSETQPTRGSFRLHLETNTNKTAEIRINSIIDVENNMQVFKLTAAPFKFFDSVTELRGKLSYQKLSPNDNNVTSYYADTVYINKIGIRDIYGNSWRFCGFNLAVGDEVNPVEVKFTQNNCS